MLKYNVKITSMACIFLAAKLEECQKRIKDILNVFHCIFQFHEMESMLPSSGSSATESQEIAATTTTSSFDFLDPQSTRFYEMSQDLIKAEHDILRELGFVLTVDHPHKFLLVYLQILGGSTALAQQAWNYLNDSLRTQLCVRFKPEIIASGAIYLAARKLGIVLPENPPWWELFDANKAQLLEVARTILDLYKRPKARYISLSAKSDQSRTNPELVAITRSPSHRQQTAPDDAASKTQSKR